MEDYLSDTEKWEWIKAQTRENGPWALAGIAGMALLLGGWRWYQSHKDTEAAAASAKYSQIIKDFEDQNRSQAFVLIGELEREYPSSPYVDQARLVAARVYVETNDLDKAASELQSVIQNTKDKQLAIIAKLRLARVQIGQQKPDVALATLNGLQPGAFATRYHEVMGDAFYAKGDKPNALKEYLTAKIGDVAGAVDTSLLDLKIADLSGDGVRAPAAPATASNAASK